ncbi:hypothetical protein TWF481_004396 [Arthrobotrys musiformis]|uniref:Uncharacterized protein n=1 Tax=Arthrobotrys musiformis TaxID=47236 RepID=A0AAV9WLC8_9PEZI
MKFKDCISSLLVFAELAVCGALSSSQRHYTASASTARAGRPTETTPIATARFTNVIGDYNRALGPSVADPYTPHHRRTDIWKRGTIAPRVDDDPSPTDPMFDRWLRPPSGPHQIYGCVNKPQLGGLLPLEIKKTGRYIMWQLENSLLSFKSQSLDPKNPCFPVFCYEDFNATVSICNRRHDMEDAVTLYGYEVGKMVWEMGVSVGFDARHFSLPWEGSKPLCEGPESEENAKISGSYVAWTSWSEDKWEVSISKEVEGCGDWRGSPNWVTTGKGLIPEEYPLDIF